MESNRLIAVPVSGMGIVGIGEGVRQYRGEWDTSMFFDSIGVVSIPQLIVLRSAVTCFVNESDFNSICSFNGIGISIRISIREDT